MENTDVIISIIVLVYNTEKYLRRCVDSILAQTFTDFELLLIDDGSTDSSGVICDEYAQKDSRVRVFHKENGGVSSARNLGLDNSNGEWISFVDSDDELRTRALEYMWGAIEDSVGIILMGCSTDSKLSSDEFVRLLLKRTVPVALWGKLYKKEVLKKIDIPANIYYGEDLIYNLMVGLQMHKSVALLKEIHYIYTYNEMSVSNTRTSSIEYEEMYINYIEKIIGEQKYNYLQELNYLKLYILEDLIVCRNEISNKRCPWVEPLVEWGRNEKLPFRKKIVINFCDNKLCRYLLALERKVRLLSNWCCSVLKNK